LNGALPNSTTGAHLRNSPVGAFRIRLERSQAVKVTARVTGGDFAKCAGSFKNIHLKCLVFSKRLGYCLIRNITNSESARHALVWRKITIRLGEAMPVNAALLVPLSLCLLGTAGSVHATVSAAVSFAAPNAIVSSTAGFPANLDWRARRSTDLHLEEFAPNLGNVPSGTYVIGNGKGSEHDGTPANQRDVSDNAQQSSVLTGTALAENVPELATWAMMLVGLGAIGLGLRARRRKATLEASGTRQWWSLG
jgi:hypothetical protein